MVLSAHMGAKQSLLSEYSATAVEFEAKTICRTELNRNEHTRCYLELSFLHPNIPRPMYTFFTFGKHGGHRLQDIRNTPTDALHPE